MDALGQILGAGDRIRFLSRTLHAELMSELRWSAGEAERTRDGIDRLQIPLFVFAKGKGVKAGDALIKPLVRETESR